MNESFKMTDPNNNINLPQNQAPIPKTPFWPKFWDFLIGFLGFALIDILLIGAGNSWNFLGSYDVIFFILPLIVNFIGIFYFQNRRKYLMYGIVWIFASPIFLVLFAFGSCLVGPLFNR